MEKITRDELKECADSIKKLKGANVISQDDYAYLVAKIISFQLKEQEDD